MRKTWWYARGHVPYAPTVTLHGDVPLSMVCFSLFGNLIWPRVYFLAILVWPRVYFSEILIKRKVNYWQFVSRNPKFGDFGLEMIGFGLILV